MPRITAVIVTWNSRDFLERCLFSLRSHAGPERVEIFVVDNASADRTYLNGLEERHSVRVLLSAENLGYARAANLGLAQGTGEYCLILNPDIFFTGDPLPRLIEELERDSGLGAVAPLLRGTDGLAQVGGYYSRFPSALQYLCTKTVMARFAWVRAAALRFFHSRVDGGSVRFVEQLPGAFLFFRRELFAPGLWMNEGYFLWMEDVDFCVRIARMGKRVAVIGEEHVCHAGASSFNQTSSMWQRRIFTQSYLIYLSMNERVGSRFATRAIMAADTLYRMASLIVRGLFARDRVLSAEFRMERALLGSILSGNTTYGS